MNYYSIPGLDFDFKRRRNAVRLGANTPEGIIARVTDYFGITLDQMKQRDRHRPVVYARQVAMYIMYSRTTLSLKNIGERFGNRDHTTVLHAKQLIKDLMDVDPRVSEDVNELLKKM